MFADLPVLIQQCAPNVGQTTMMAIVRTESGGYPWSINDNTIRLPRQPASRAEAIATAKYLIAQGHSVDMGLGQVNSRNLRVLGLTVEQVFEPCTNLAASASILTDGYERATKVYGPGQRALLAALSTYNTGSMSRGFSNGYVSRVASNAGVRGYAVPALAGKASTVKYRGRSLAGTAPTTPRMDPYTAPIVPMGFVVARAE